VLQIILSELLQVPTTIETMKSDRFYNFYDAESRSDYGAATYAYETLRLASEVGGDCQKVRVEDEGTGSYRPCANVMPCVNKIGQSSMIKDLRDDGIAEACEFHL